MVFTDTEREVVAILIKAYKNHVVEIYRGNPEFLEDLRDPDELLANLHMDLELFEDGQIEFRDLHMGILRSIIGSLKVYDITDTASPLYTVLEKTERIVTLKETQQSSN